MRRLPVLISTVVAMPACSGMFVPSMPISVVSGFRVTGNTRFCVRCAVPDCVLLVGFALFCSVCSASGWGWRHG